MGINIIPGFLKKQKNEPDSTYLALTLSPNRTIAAAWVLNQDDVQILGISAKSYTNSESLLRESAEAIDGAAKLSKSDISKTVFGLSSSYFEGQNLSQEASAALKSLSEELELDAQAYVSLASSVNHFLKIKESVTPNAILIGSFGDFTEVHLVRNNKVVSTKTSKGQPTSIEKIIQLTNQIKTEEGQDLPSRIVVYGAVEDSHLGKEITKKEEWKDLFVSTPKIDFLDYEQIAEAVAYSQAADVLGHDPTTVLAKEKQNQETKEKLEDEGEQKESEQINQPTDGSVLDMGFVEGEDILEIEKDKLKKPFGQTNPDHENLNNVEAVEQYAVEGGRQVSVEREVPEQKQTPRLKKGPGIVEKISTLAWLPSLLGAKIGRQSRKKLLITIGFLLLLFFGGYYFASKTFTSVQIIIMANTKSQQGDFKAGVQPGGALDASQNTIPGQAITASADGSQKAVTTGTKNTGDQAKGQVNIFNWTTNPKTFSSGTVLITSDGVKFTLDSNVDVASRSASLPGESQANVTAQNFGTDGNIPAGKDLTFQQYDQLLYSAKNDNAFTGGDQKQVTVVSQEDIDKLSKSLQDTLTQQAKSNLQNSAQGQQLNDDAITITVTKKQFDKNLNDEASLLNLSMTVQAKAIVYSSDDLKNIIAQNINLRAPDNLEARPENIQVTNLSSQVTNSGLSLSGQYNVDLVPKFNDSDLKNQIAGKSVKDARAIITQIPQVSDVQFQFSPKLSIFFMIPTNKDKISFKIVSSK